MKTFNVMKQTLLLLSAVLLLGLAPASTWAQTTDSGRSLSLHRMPTGAERWSLLGEEVFSAPFVVGSVIGGTVEHLQDEPAAWRGDVVGLGARVTSSAGRALVFTGTEHGLVATLRADLRYAPLKRGGVGRRVGHVLVESLTVRTDGGRLPNAPFASGSVVSTVAQNQWETGALSTRDVGLNLAISLGVETISNLVAEFVR